MRLCAWVCMFVYVWEGKPCEKKNENGSDGMMEQKMEAVSWAFVRLCTVCAVMQLIAFPFVFVRAQVGVCVLMYMGLCVVIQFLSAVELSSPPP